MAGLQREVDSLREDNRKLQSVLDSERAVRSAAQNEAHKLRVHVTQLVQKQDELEGKLEAEMARFSGMVKERMAATARIVKQLSRREAELQNMRIQTNNQYIGTLVRKDGAAMSDAPSEYFEAGFAFHQLHAVRCPASGFVCSLRRSYKNNIGKHYLEKAQGCKL